MHKGAPPNLLQGIAVAVPRVQAPFAASSILAHANGPRRLLCSVLRLQFEWNLGLTGRTFRTKAKGDTVATVNTLYRKYL
jgi:hypothetical protein